MSNPTAASSNDLPKAKFQTETTGNYWQDVKEAIKRISPREDVQHIGEIPCARSSLLSGIASGMGIGVVRALSVGPFIASNWAVGTFMVVTLGTWTICRNNRERELREIGKVVEMAPKRFVEHKEEGPPTSPSPPS